MPRGTDSSSAPGTFLGEGGVSKFAQSQSSPWGQAGASEHLLEGTSQPEPSPLPSHLTQLRGEGIHSFA